MTEQVRKLERLMALGMWVLLGGGVLFLVLSVLALLQDHAEISGPVSGMTAWGCGAGMTIYVAGKKAIGLLKQTAAPGADQDLPQNRGWPCSELWAARWRKIRVYRARARRR